MVCFGQHAYEGERRFQPGNKTALAELPLLMPSLPPEKAPSHLAPSQAALGAVSIQMISGCLADKPTGCDDVSQCCQTELLLLLTEVVLCCQLSC